MKKGRDEIGKTPGPPKRSFRKPEPVWFLKGHKWSAYFVQWEMFNLYRPGHYDSSCSDRENPLSSTTRWWNPTLSYWFVAGNLLSWFIYKGRGLWGNWVVGHLSRRPKGEVCFDLLRFRVASPDDACPYILTLSHRRAVFCLALYEEAFQSFASIAKIFLFISFCLGAWNIDTCLYRQARQSTSSTWSTMRPYADP